MSIRYLPEVMTGAFVTGFANGWKKHPPSALANSPDPREHDGVDRQALRRAFLAWAETVPTLNALPNRDLTRLIDAEIEHWGSAL